MKSDHKITNGQITIATFYRFVRLEDYAELQTSLMAYCKAHDIRGIILLAPEGINSTISGSAEAVEAFFEMLAQDDRFKDIYRKYSYAETPPFKRIKVRLKKEIVRMGVEDLDLKERGTYLNSKDWDALISEPDVMVIDTRNDYEVEIGKFAGAVNPDTHNFRDLPAWVDQNLDPKKHTKIAMYCTGGIRCEKSTALLKQKGFKDVFHLNGGILQYLEDTANQSNKWQGECFVFDERVAVDEHLKPTGRVVCGACGMPVKPHQAKPGEIHEWECDDCRGEK